MAQRLIPPLAQVLDDAGQPRDGARLFFYASGTSTKLSTYSDAALATPNANPLLLDEFGMPPSGVFGQNLPYKIVLAAADELASDPPSNVIATYDPVSSSDFGRFLQTTTGSGSPNGSVAGTAGSAGVLPSTFWDFTAKILYFCTVTGTASTAVWVALNASASQPAVPPPQGYLTLTSGIPVITGDVVSATAVYYTPDEGSLVPIYNGSSFTPTQFNELTLALVASHALNTIYDVFVFSNAGVLTLVTGPAWSNSAAGSGTRGTGASTTQLSRISGFFVNAVAITGRNGSTTYSIGANLATYLGSIFIDGTAGQITCHRGYGQSRKWGVWNAFNRKPTFLKAGDGTASWTYTTNTTRASRATSANSLTLFSGLAQETYDLRFNQNVFSTAVANNQTANALIGIGYNSTTAISGKEGQQTLTNSTGGSMDFGVNLTANFKAPPAHGINVITALENGQGSTGSLLTFQGTEAHMLLSADWRA